MLLLGFLLSSRGVYAYNDVPYEDNLDINIGVLGNPTYISNEPIWSSGAMKHFIANGSTSSALYFPGYGVRDIYIRRNIQWSNYGSYNFNFSYKGYFRYKEDFFIDDFCRNFSGVNVEYISYEGVSVETEQDYSIFDRSIKTFNFGDAGTQYWNNVSGVLTFNADTNVYLQGEYLVGYVSTTLIYHFKIYYVTTLGFTAPADVKFTTSYNNSNLSITSRFSRAYSDKYYLYNIAESIQSANSGIISAINQAKNQAHNDSVTLNNSVTEAKNQAHQDSVTQNNILTTDSTGTSTVVSGIENDYNVVQSQADDAVDNAVHNYNNDLATVENYNFNSFFTSQRSAATFWRNVGEYILNSGELGFVASGVIITTLITLFVFMLRL